MEVLFNQAHLLSQPSWGYVAIAGAQSDFPPHQTVVITQILWAVTWHIVGSQWILTESRYRNHFFSTTLLPRVKHTPAATRQKYSPTAQAMEGGSVVGKSRFQVPAATRKGNIGCLRCQSQEWEQMWKSNTGFHKYKLFICVLRKPIHRSSRPLSPRGSFLPNGRRVAIFFLVAVWVLAGWQGVGWAVQWPPGRWGQPGQGECLLPLIFSEWAP